MTKKSTPKGSGQRFTKERVKTAAKRSNSSTKWLQRQLNDPYVKQAKVDGYRSRAAYKLLELDEKFSLIKPGAKVIDLGCAPGGWAQVAVAKAGQKGRVVGIDLLEVEPVAGAMLIVQDFLAEDAPGIVRKLLAGEGNDDEVRADIVMSDMAANTTGHTTTDHIRIMHLCELAYHFATEVLAPGGHFICKVLKGGTENQLLSQMKKDFTSVKHAKPKASRADSAESYVVALGFRG